MEEIVEKLDRLNWLLGAIESQNELTLRLKAEEMGIEVIWWDPSKGLPPDDGKVHGETAKVTKIYQYLPVRLRGKK